MKRMRICQSVANKFSKSNIYGLSPKNRYVHITQINEKMMVHCIGDYYRKIVYCLKAINKNI